MKLPCVVAFVAALSLLAGGAAAQDFPLNRELLLDAAPLRPSKRIPSIALSADGQVIIDLWCRSVAGTAELGEGTLRIVSEVSPQDLALRDLPQMMGPGQCTDPRQRADEDLLSGLLDTTGWRREGDAVVLSGGPKALRFRPGTN